MKIYPVLPGGNILQLGTTIEALEPYAAGFHLDIMDFQFVPNLTFGPDFVNIIRRQTKAQLWLHLMVAKPFEVLKHFQLNKSDMITIHVEALSSPQMLAEIQAVFHRTGVAINPATHLAEILPYIGKAHHFLVMSVNPGFAGQIFIPETLEKFRKLAQLRNEQSHAFELYGDGGINKENLPLLRQVGVQAVAISSGLYEFPDPVKELNELMKESL
jgi:ribulose-phosphate 3-epimerase